MLTDLHVCPATLKTDQSTFSTTALRTLFDGRKVSHILPFQRSTAPDDLFQVNRRRISISGVQIKSSLRLDGRLLTLTDQAGQYILKPAPFDLNHRLDVPANEHLTMQLAKQVFGFAVPPNALVFFPDGEMAYLIRRFDYKPDGTKLAIEDFASVLGRTEQRSGPTFKYDGYYSDIVAAMQQHVPAWRVEVEKLFRLVVFNFLFGNGDAHLKNFSLIESQQGDYVLSPVYDLINTAWHVNDTDLALDGLFPGDDETANFQDNAFYTFDEFYLFGLHCQIAPARVRKLIDGLLASTASIENLIAASFLSEEGKQFYQHHYHDRRKRLLMRRL
jgi:serine/threonine-protein kinase HipA